MADNACGCLARLIMKHPEAVPLESTLPTLIQSLPLKTDFEENEPVFQCLMGLIKAQNPVVMSHLDKLKEVFHMVIASEEMLKPETRQQLLQMLGV